MRVAKSLYTHRDLGRALLKQAHSLRAMEHPVDGEERMKIFTRLARKGASLSGLNGFGGLLGGDLVESLRTGDAIPDDLFGWSTKTVLVGIIVIMLLKQKLK